MSRQDRKLEPQRDALLADGCEGIFEKIRCREAKRAALREAFDRRREGDVLTVGSGMGEEGKAGLTEDSEGGKLKVCLTGGGEGVTARPTVRRGQRRHPRRSSHAASRRGSRRMSRIRPRRRGIVTGGIVAAERARIPTIRGAPRLRRTRDASKRPGGLQEGLVFLCRRMPVRARFRAPLPGAALPLLAGPR